MKSKQTINIQREPVLVEVRGLSKSFGDRLIFKDLTLTINPGEIFVLMGPSGVGKSVFLKTIIGLEAPDEGSAWVHGLNAADPLTREKVVMSLVFQSGALFNSMTIFENLALYLQEHALYSREAIVQKVNRVLKLLRLEHTADWYPSSLSGGMRKRVSIARALVMEPQLLLYDEPTSELDPQTGAMIAEVIATLREEIGVTSIVVSHDKHLALSIADRVGVLMDGSLKALGAPEALQASQDPQLQAFLNPTIDPRNPRFRREVS